MAISLKKRFWKQKDKVLSADEQVRFLRQLYRLLKTGYPLLKALEMIRWDAPLAKAVDEIIETLKKGQTIDEAFAHVNFHSSITSYLSFVKANGDLPLNIKKCLKMYESRLAYRKKLQTLLRYPLILLSFFSVLLLFIKQFILPTFIDLFPAHSEAASTVVIMLLMMDYFLSFVIIVIILGCLGLLFWKKYHSKLTTEQKINIYTYIPLYRYYVKIQTSYLFATHVSTLLQAGLPMKKILHHMSIHDKLPIIAYYSKLIIADLQKGFPIEGSLHTCFFIDDQLKSIFKKLSNKKTLANDLKVYADILMDELNRKMMKILTLVQPIFFMMLASFIIFIYMTLMWPMFQLIKTI